MSSSVHFYFIDQIAGLSFISLTNSTTDLGHYVSHRKASLRECVRDMCLVPSVSVSNTNNEVAVIYFNIYNYTSSEREREQCS